MIWDGILDIELAEPAIGKVHLYLTADNRSERTAKDNQTTSMRIISSGSTDGRPMDK
jgi:hypothetical protein